MKYKIFFYLVFIGILGGVWTSCDKVEEPVKLVSNITITDCDRLLDDVYVMDSVYVDRKQVLLEEFTGHKCVNCAGASIEAHEWSEANDHRLIIYGIHAGYYAEPDATGLYITDFRCPLGDELYNDFAPPANPYATINRVEYDGNLTHPANKWENIIGQEMAKNNVVDMTVYSIYYPNLDIFEVKVIATFLEQLDGKFKIAIYLAEDGIVAPQRNNEEEIGPTPDWLDYVHRNVVRGAINGKNGTLISLDGSIVQGEEYCNKFEHPLLEDWDPNSTDLNAIAFIYQEETHEILQVAELGIETE